ncbi:MAG: hypothetical protein ACKVY0_24145 [Prosthecobacter sp.]|uniref:CsbD family protein n=1 Tax=Prosthecobacter sp. TaxID=1965333 RepID=UPI0039040377
MTKLAFQGSWNEIKGRLKQKYAQCTDDNLLFSEGQDEELLGRLQKQTGAMQEKLRAYLATLPIHCLYTLKPMKTPPFQSLLFVGILLLTLPALHAADRIPGFQSQAAQTAPPTPKKQGFFSMLFGGKTRQVGNDRRRSVAVALPRSQMPQVATSLQPTRTYSNPIPGQGEIIRTHDNTRMIVKPLPLTPSRVVAPPVPSVSVPASPSLDPTVSPATGASTMTSLPGGRQESSTANTQAAAPMFARPVPGKPGCVYPPGLKQIPANIVDVTDMHPGSKARDPVTNIVFVVP